MDNFPAKQSVFSKIRNGILNAGLKNRFTRGIMANIAPNIFGPGLIKFVLSNDSQDLSETMRLLSSMNENAVKANIKHILEESKRIIRSHAKNPFEDSQSDQFVNMILDAVTEDATEFVIRKMLDRMDLLDSSISDETCKRIADSIDCRSKSSVEIGELFEKLLGRIVLKDDKYAEEKIVHNLLENLTLEQRKELFSNLLSRTYSSYRLPDFSLLLEQLPEEDRLEQYKKILEVHKYESNMSRKNIDSLSKGFALLSEDERVSVLEETVEQIIDILEYNGKSISQMSKYISKLDISLQREIVLDVVNKSREVLQSENQFSKDLEILKLINAFEPDIISDAFIKILNGNVNDPNTKFVFDLLKKDIIMENIASVITEEKLYNILSILNHQHPDYIQTHDKIIRIFVSSRLGKIENAYNNLDENSKKQSIDEVLTELSKQFEIISKYGEHYVKIVNQLQVYAINDVFLSLDEKEKSKHIDALFEALNNIKDDETKKSAFIDLFKHLDNETKINIFNTCISPSSGNLKYAVNILSNYSVEELYTIFKDEVILDEETISKLMALQDDISAKALLFGKDVDREKLVDLFTYEQLQVSKAISIDSIIQNLYVNTKGKSKQEFNQLLGDIYNLFTYNNVPEFMKNFRIFQLGAYYNIQNEKIKSFQDKSIEERDTLILEDLFKISLDSNNVSLRDFSNVIIEGKRLTTVLQVNPEEKIKSLSEEELALLNQYRDTLFDLHNITKEIRKTSRPKIEKTDDVIKDLRLLIAIYSDNQEHNPNSKNIVFNPNKIMDELFKGFITTTIRPNAMLEYMDKIKAESDARHLEIEKKLKDGTMHLEAGDFVKGIRNFDDYIPSMLRDGIKGGEFNQEHSHSDTTPLDADFGYVSKGNLKKENATDYDVILTTISNGYGDNYIVLKQYADRLQDRSRENFDQGTFTGSPDYYEDGAGEEATDNSRYIRTGIPITDVDYIVSVDWNPKNGYEMAMAGIYIPVINSKGEVVFSSEEYYRIREEMRGLSHYNAENIQVSPDAKDMETLYVIYRSVSKKMAEEIDREIETVRGLVEGKPDTITMQKKKATTEFIRNFFRSQGIKATDDLSQNLSTSSVELIDTGSTGRGTNVPGDGDFDFMLRHNLPSDLLGKLTEKVRELTTKEFVTVGDGFRAKDVALPTGEVVDIDITTAKKSLALSYSSDMCVRDRLNNIRENDPESYTYVQANIIMAKKILKAKGIYKKLGSDGATEHGGFGGIGVENWILQNGGSFKQAIDTFLKAANEVESYDEFKKKYPIFDFGLNHREGKIRHDRFSAFLANDTNNPEIGFKYVKETLAEIQKALELEKGREGLRTPLIQSISPEGFEEAGRKRSVLRNKFSYSRVRGMISKYMSNKEVDDVQVGDSQDQSDLEVE